MGETRRAVEKSWDAARRVADDDGIVRANAATCAGQYLAVAGGDAQRALAMLPMGGAGFWARVGALLAEVVTEDAAERRPQLKAAGGGR